MGQQMDTVKVMRLCALELGLNRIFLGLNGIDFLGLIGLKSDKS
ncbi:MAG: hypothetical protein RLZZ628_1859 [Bacteroidota bacterium]|jgi:hypothetical protein